MTRDVDTTPFGRLLRRHRTQRNVTQERLAYRADLSTRHVSFLETGRSGPSRASVLALARALDLPLRDRNALLRAAGFAAAYPDRDLLAPEGSHVRSLFGFLLCRHEPFPAYVVDRAWTVRMHNRAAVDLLAWLLEEDLRQEGQAARGSPAGTPGGPGVGGGRRVPAGTPPRDGSDGAPGEQASGDLSRRLAGANLLRLLFDPERLRPLTVNFGEVGRFLWDRLEEEIALRPEDDELEKLRRELEELGPLPDDAPGIPEGNGPPALPVHLEKDGRDLRLLSFLVTVAAPREVGLQEIRMETFLPADEASETLLRDVGTR